MLKELCGSGRGILTPVFFVVFLFCIGCNGGGNPNLPDSDDERSLPWTISGGDEPVSDTAADEQEVDITNVVYSHAWGAIKGHIKKYNVPVGDPYTYTVATWQQPNGNLVDIYFEVLYRDGVDPIDDDNMGIARKVDGGYANEIQIQPAITAHLDADQLIVVDLVFVSRPWSIENPNPNNWRIIHARYRQDSYGNFNAFSFVSSEDITPGHVFHDNCNQPDIVFDAGAESEDARERLHVVHVIAWEYYDRDIWYVRGDTGVDGLIDWHTREMAINHIGYTYIGLNTWPRIDVGYDASCFIHTQPQGTHGTQAYYVGIVWQYSWYDVINEVWPTDVVYAQIPAGEPLLYWRWAGKVAGGWSIGMHQPHVIHHMAIPYIDIEPVENTSDNRTTMITWTHAEQLEGENDYQAAKIEATNTFRLYEGNIQVELFSDQGPGNLNGVATFAIKADDTNCGYLTWLNCNGLNYNGHVYAGEVFWDIDLIPYIWSDSTWFNISSGHSSVAPDTGYRLGPEVAMFGENVGKCIWTDIANGTTPSIWGDSSDWFD